MLPRLARRTTLLAAPALLLVAGLGGWLWLRSAGSGPLFRRLPAEHLLLAHLDVRGLRRASALAPLLRARVDPDPDYAAFVKQTGFDYQTDLDEAAVCYLPDRVYMLARGRFTPAKLRQYALSQGGSCQAEDLDRPCRMPSSRPDRQISFLLLSATVLAIATAPEPDAVLQLESSPVPNAEPLAEAARGHGPALLWLTAAPASLDRVLRQGPEPSPVTALFARALSGAQRAYVLAADQSPNIGLSLTAVCTGPDKAEEMRRLLTGLNELVAALARPRQGQADPWARVISSAVVRQDKSTVHASWTLNEEALKGLAAP